MSKVDDLYLDFLAQVVERARRHAALVVIAALLLTGICVYYVAIRFAVNTDMSALLSRDLPFQKLSAQYHRAFPQLSDTILVVIDGQSAGLADQAAERLVHWIERHPGQFDGAYAPGGGKFFEKQGLLYLSTDQLQKLSDRLSQAQPLIARLAADPSMRGLFKLMGQGLQQQAAGGGTFPGLTTALARMGETVVAFNHGRFAVMPWENLISGGSSSLSGRQRFVIVNPHLDHDARQPAAASITTLRDAIRQLHLTQDRGVGVRLTGTAVLDNDQLQAASNGAGVATFLSLGLVLVLLIIGLHTWRKVVASLVTLLMGLAWTTAFALLAVGTFNLISISFAVLFVGLAVDFSIQFCMRYREALHQFPQTPALRETARGVGGALTLAALAAAVSFYSVVPTSYAGVVDLGLIAGTSMLIALAANLTVLPALLVCLGVRDQGRIRPHLPFASVPLHRWGFGITVAASMLGLVAIPFALRIHFDFNPLSLQDQQSQAVRTLKDLMRNDRLSPYTIDVLAPNMKAAQEMKARIEQLPAVSNAITLGSFVPDQQARKLDIIDQIALIMPPFSLQIDHHPKPGPKVLRQSLSQFLQYLHQPGGKTNAPMPEARDLATALERFKKRSGNDPQALELLQQRLVATLPAQLRRLRLSLQAQGVSLSTLPKDLKQRYVSDSGRTRIEVMSNLDLSKQKNMRRFVQAVREIAPNAVGLPVLLVDGGNAVVHAFVQATITAAVLITLLLLAVLRRPIDVALALSPLLLAGVLTVATMQWLGMSFNLANIIVLPLLIGLGVAYGIYFVLRWREGVDLEQVMRSSTPEAVFFSALTTLCSFGSLAAASSPGMKILGVTLCITLGYILVCTLLVLPAVLTVIPHAPLRRQPGVGE